MPATSAGDGGRSRHERRFSIGPGHRDIGFAHVAHEDAVARIVDGENLGKGSRPLQCVQQERAGGADHVALAAEADAVGHHPDGRHERHALGTLVVSEGQELIRQRAHGQLRPGRRVQIFPHNVRGHVVTAAVFLGEFGHILVGGSGGPADVFLDGHRMRLDAQRRGKELAVHGEVSHAGERIAHQSDTGVAHAAGGGCGGEEIRQGCGSGRILHVRGDILEPHAFPPKHVRQVLRAVDAVIARHGRPVERLVDGVAFLDVPDDDRQRCPLQRRQGKKAG